MSVRLPHPDLAAIRSWLGEREITKGRPYLEREALSHQQQQGATVRARCQGTDPTPYRVEVILGRRNISAADCSCPVGGGGRCKHVAALLLAWLEQPDTFTEIPLLETTLEQLDRPALLDLVTRMVRREPDLELLVRLAAFERQPGVPGPEVLRPLVGELIEDGAQRRRHHDTWGDEWYEPFDPTDLERVIALLERHAASGKAAEAGFGAVAEGLRHRLRTIEDLEDDEGTLRTLLQRCE
jgi:uncharacterized Zn finger protein